MTFQRTSFEKTRVWCALSTALALTCAAGCGSKPPAPTPAWTPSPQPAVVNTATNAIDGERCKQQGRIDARPFVVTWDATDQAEFSALVHNSIAVFRVQGCEIELLPACLIPGNYALTKTGGNLQRLFISDRNELYASLPLGVVALSGRVEQQGALELSYFVSGLRQGSAMVLYRNQLGPGCEGATHFVINYAEGAYALGTSSSAAVGAGVDVAGVAGAGGESSQAMEILFTGGDIDNCQAAGQGCGAPVRLRLFQIKEIVPEGDEAVAAELFVTKPGEVAPSVPPGKTGESSVKKGLRHAFRHAIRACIQENGTRWGQDDRAVLTFGIDFERSGRARKVRLEVRAGTDRLDAALAPAVECMRQSLFSARAPKRKKRVSYDFVDEWLDGPACGDRLAIGYDCPPPLLRCAGPNCSLDLTPEQLEQVTAALKEGMDRLSIAVTLPQARSIQKVANTDQYLLDVVVIPQTLSGDRVTIFGVSFAPR